MKSILDIIADTLDKASRIGTDEDVPEGARYIQISDTLAKDIAEQLRNYK